MIPFNRPPVLGRELENIAEVLGRRKLSGDGPFTRRCSAMLEQRLAAPRVLLAHSGTAALEMAAILCDLKPLDEVVMPSFTFVSTANAVVLRGAVPVFVDIDPLTQNIDPALVEAAITPRTRAIFVVHYAGIPCNMDAIAAIAHRHRLPVVEDAAQALGSHYKGRPAGTLGAMAAFSFHETKNIVSGEGGALAVTSPALVERAEIIREKGTDRSKFLRGEVDKYTWVDIGSSYLPSELIAAFLEAQLEHVDAVIASRRTTWNLYHAAFERLEQTGRARRPVVPPDVEHNGHLYYLLLDDLADRTRSIDDMRKAGAAPVFHYVPLHSSPAGLRYSRTHGELTVTDDTAARLVRLPIFHGMEAEREAVVDLVIRLLA